MRLLKFEIGVFRYGREHKKETMKERTMSDLATKQLEYNHDMFSILGNRSNLHMPGRGTARAEDAQGTLTQSHISPSILVYEEEWCLVGSENYYTTGPYQ